MSDVLAGVLFQSETRTAVLDLLFVRGVAASVSELARRTGLSARVVGHEVRHLRTSGLVSVEAVGSADVVRANHQHPAARHLKALLTMPSEPPRDETLARRVRESLAGWRAPLAGVRPVKHLSLEESLLHGLDEAKNDATVLRVLPLVLQRNAQDLDWPELREGARRRKLKAELGVVAELCSVVTSTPSFSENVAELHDARRKTMRFLPAVKNEYEAKLAELRSPEVARRWGFLMNATLESFRDLVEKHRA